MPAREGGRIGTVLVRPGDLLLDFQGAQSPRGSHLCGVHPDRQNLLGSFGVKTDCGVDIVAKVRAFLFRVDPSSTAAQYMVGLAMLMQDKVTPEVVEHLASAAKTYAKAKMFLIEVQEELKKKGPQ